MNQPECSPDPHGLHNIRFGVNYTPTRSWWFCWNDFDAGAIARDLDAIASIGADHIRTMLIWPFFQPNPTCVSEVHLDRLDRLMRLAAERSLDVCVSVFTGWLSGYAFKPAYQRDDTFYDLNDETTAPQHLFMDSVCECLRPHDNVIGIDLGNEMSCSWSTADLAVGDRWHRHMLDRVNGLLPGGIHGNGLGHSPWFEPTVFSPRTLAETQDLIPLHCWTLFTGALERSGGDISHPRCVRLLESMAAFARAHAGDPRKPVWIQEFGMSEEWTDAERIPEFLRESVMAAIRSGVNWFTWWCSHDIDPRYQFHPMEYSMGLIERDQTVKPYGRVFRELAKEYGCRRAVDTPASDLPRPPPLPETESTWAWLDRWMESHPEGA
jgi:endo-1,4-beta-mannosidase